MDLGHATYRAPGCPLCLRGEHPDVSRPVRGLGPLPEVGVHREVVAHAVLPAVVLRAEVRVVLTVNINS